MQRNIPKRLLAVVAVAGLGSEATSAELLPRDVCRFLADSLLGFVPRGVVVRVASAVMGVTVAEARVVFWGKAGAISALVMGGRGYFVSLDAAGGFCRSCER